MNKIELNRIYNEDCQEGIKRIPDGFVDLVVTDPPYNTTDCEWDRSVLISETLKKEILRILKPEGTICIFAQHPFSFVVGSVFGDIYRHRWVWVKDKCGNFLCAKGAPLKYTEDILVFSRYGYIKPWNNNSKPKGVYNPQMRNGTGKARGTNSERFGLSSTSISKRPKYSKLVSNPKTDGIVRYPSEILHFNVPHRKDERFHPTQKPVALLEYLIKTYSNENDVVLDICMGSGTTAIACVNTNRRYIGFEINKEYYYDSVKRLNKVLSEPKLVM